MPIIITIMILIIKKKKNNSNNINNDRNNSNNDNNNVTTIETIDSISFKLNWKNYFLELRIALPYLGYILNITKTKLTKAVKENKIKFCKL